MALDIYLSCILQIFEDSIKLQSIWTNAREQLEKGELKTPEHSSEEEEEEKQVKTPAPKSSKKRKSKKEAELGQLYYSNIPF